MRITHIVFDMDGTLVDTAKATYQACCQITDEMGLNRIPKETLIDAMGIPGLDYYRKILPSLNDDTLGDFARRTDMAENNAIQLLGEALLFDGIKKILRELSGCGIKLYIASTGSLKHVNTTLSATGIRDCFTGIYCDHPNKAESIGRIPDLREGGVWIMVGDKRIDANAARHHSIVSVGVAFGYCTPNERVFFDKVVFTPLVLLEFLRQA